MSNINNGGPAFPAGHVRKSRPAHDPGADFRVTDIVEPKQAGMSLRDWFAGQALSCISLERVIAVNGAGYAASLAYKVADAMLAEREKGGAV